MELVAQSPAAGPCRTDAATMSIPNRRNSFWPRRESRLGRRQLRDRDHDADVCLNMFQYR